MIWTDSDLLRLSRDTRWWITHDIDGNQLGDYYDARRHVPILYSLAVNVNWADPRMLAPVRGPIAVEIGVRHGVTTMALLHAMREAGGVLISLEIDPECAEATRRRVEKAGLLRWWAPQVMHSDDYVDKLPKVIDFLWIDGDHRYEQVRKDVDNYGSRVRVNGIMALHDYWHSPDPEHPIDGMIETGVGPVVEEMRKSGDWEIVTLPFSFGLSICRRAT